MVEIANLPGPRKNVACSDLSVVPRSDVARSTTLEGVIKILFLWLTMTGFDCATSLIRWLNLVSPPGLDLTTL